MKLTNRQIVESVSHLSKLVQQKLPAKTAFRMSKLIKQIENVQESYNEAVKKVQDTYFEKDDEGNYVVEDNHYKVKEEHREDYTKEMKELLDDETEIKFKKLKLEHLGKIDLEPTLFYHLDWMFEDED